MFLTVWFLLGLVRFLTVYTSLCFICIFPYGKLVRLGIRYSKFFSVFMELWT